MSKFVKTAIAAAMVMGVFTSTATIAAGNLHTALIKHIRKSFWAFLVFTKIVWTPYLTVTT